MIRSMSFCLVWYECSYDVLSCCTASRRGACLACGACHFWYNGRGTTVSCADSFRDAGRYVCRTCNIFVGGYYTVAALGASCCRSRSRLRHFCYPKRHRCFPAVLCILGVMLLSRPPRRGSGALPQGLLSTTVYPHRYVRLFIWTVAILVSKETQNAFLWELKIG